MNENRAGYRLMVIIMAFLGFNFGMGVFTFYVLDSHAMTTFFFGMVFLYIILAVMVNSRMRWKRGCGCR